MEFPFSIVPGGASAPPVFAPGVAVWATMEAMMFRGASERQSFTGRVASHATKGRANGRVDVLPPATLQEETLYQDAKRQFDLAHKRAVETDAEIAEIKERLGRSLPYSESARLQERLKALTTVRGRLWTVVGECRDAARAIGEKSFVGCFYFIAALRLPHDVFRAIDEEVAALMGRPRHEIKQGSQKARQKYIARQQTKRAQGGHGDSARAS